MLTVETIGKIRVASSKGKSIRQISRELNVSRNTVRKVLRSGATEFEYSCKVQHRPQLRLYVEKLEELLEADEKLPKKQRRTAQVLFEELQAQGYSGAYDSVRLM